MICKKIVNDNVEIVLYAYDSSIIITTLNPTNFTNSANKILQDINKWFTTTLLSLNACGNLPQSSFTLVPVSESPAV
jgi:hypothetical protein